jgi:hypothetical protein
LVGASPISEFIRKREDDEEVMSRESKLISFIKPDVSAVVHTLGTVAVLARMVGIVRLVTILADKYLSNFFTA